MSFDNKKIILQLNIRRYLALIAFFVSVSSLLFPDFIKEIIFGFDKSNLVTIVVFIYVVYILFTYIKNYHYFYFSDDSKKLIFRFFSTRPFDSKRTAIEINKNDFVGYKFKNSLLNLKQVLIINVRTRNGIASYPPISVTALSFEHKEMLKNSLNQLV